MWMSLSLILFVSHLQPPYPIFLLLLPSKYMQPPFFHHSACYHSALSHHWWSTGQIFLLLFFFTVPFWHGSNSLFWENSNIESLHKWLSLFAQRSYFPSSALLLPQWLCWYSSNHPRHTVASKSFFYPFFLPRIPYPTHPHGSISISSFYLLEFHLLKKVYCSRFCHQHLLPLPSVWLDLAIWLALVDETEGRKKLW